MRASLRTRACRCSLRRLQRLVPPETDAAELLSVLWLCWCRGAGSKQRDAHDARLRSYGDEAPPGEYDKAERAWPFDTTRCCSSRAGPPFRSTLQSDGISVKAWRPAVVGLAEGADGMSWKFVARCARARARASLSRPRRRSTDERAHSRRSARRLTSPRARALRLSPAARHRLQSEHGDVVGKQATVGERRTTPCARRGLRSASSLGPCALGEHSARREQPI